MDVQRRDDAERDESDCRVGSRLLEAQNLMQMSQVSVAPETAFLSGWGGAPLVYGFEIAILKPGPYQLRVAACT